MKMLSFLLIGSILFGVCSSQLILPWFQQSEATPKIIDGPKSQSIPVMGIAVFRCAIARADLAQRILWTYLDHGLVLSVNRTLLVLDSRYRILNQPLDSSSTHFDLQINNVTAEDAGTYSCQVISGNGNKLIQTAVLTINGSSTSTLPTVGIHATMLFERQECCRRMNVSTSCQKLCSGQSTWSAYDIVSSVQCMNYLGTFVYCASDQRNHVPCCIRRFVAADCLDFCAPPAGPNLTGFGLGRVASLSLRCFPQLASITRCMEEGQHTIPDPPRGVSLTPLTSYSLLVRWLPPSTTGFYTESQIKYRVFIAVLDSNDQEFSDNDFQITPGLTSNTEMEIVDLKPSTRYAVYVTAVSPHGSSAPSFIADIYTPPFVRPTEDDHSFVQDCCRKANVPTECADLFCSARHTPEQIANITGSNYAYSCADSLQSAFTCLSGKYDHQICCKTRRIPSNCLPFCSPHAPPFGLEHASCLRYVGLMNACFMEGKQMFPGVPANFTLENVTTTSAIFDWSPPVDNAKVVSRYRLLIKPHSLAPVEEDAAQWQAIPTTNTRMAVSGLDPDQPYTATLWAESESGPGWTSIIDFSTLPVPVIGNATNIQPDMTSCCSMLGVKSECMRYCDVSVFANTSAAASADPVLFYSCLNADFHKVLACAADGRNHSLCCARQGIPTPCLRVCAVSPNYRDIGRDQAMCVSFSQTIVQCLREGWTTIPKPPRSLDVYNITANSVVLSWRPPPADSPYFSTYLISAWSGTRDDRTDTEYAMPVASKAAFYERLVTGLNPQLQYTFRVFAINSAGRSLASNEISVVTAPDDTSNESSTLVSPTQIPFSAWTNNMSACCASLQLSGACRGACTDIRAMNAMLCPDDIPQLLACWSSADPDSSKGNSECCANSGVPSPCLQLCTSSAPQVKSIPRTCISSVPLIISCYQRRFSSIPSPPRRLSVLSTSALSAILRWLPPSRNAATLASYTLFYFPEPNSTSIVSIPNITAIAPAAYPSAIDDSDDPDDITTVIDPGMMTFTVGDLRPSTLYRAWAVAVSNTSAISLPSAEVVFSTSRESLYVTMLLSPGEYAPTGKSFSLLCSPQFAFSNVTWWYSAPGGMSDSYVGRPTGLMAASSNAQVRVQIPTPTVKPTNLTLNPLMPNASGQYTCRVMSNYSKNFYESTRFVKVMSTPIAMQPFQKLTLPTRYYTTIPINCTFTGYPVSFRWYQGAVPFRSFPRTSFSGNTSVSIISVLASSIESTSFTCNATNLFGSAVCEVAVDFVKVAIPTVAPTMLPWFPTKKPLTPQPDQSFVSVDIPSLAVMVDGDCCMRAIRLLSGCQCAHQTAVASRTLTLPQKCLDAMSKCALSESLPSAPRDLNVFMGAYSANASWVPPLKSNYLNRFKVTFSSPLDPRSPMVDFAEISTNDSNLFWARGTEVTEVARFGYSRNGLLPGLSYTVTVSSLNLYNFTDPSEGMVQTDIATRLPGSDEPLPVIAVSVSRSSAMFATIQWSVRTPPAVSMFLVSSPTDKFDVYYRAAPTPNVMKAAAKSSNLANNFFRVQVDSQARQVTISLNSSTEYYVVVIGVLKFRNVPTIVGSTPMQLSSSSGSETIYASAIGGEIVTMNERYSSMRNMALGFGLTLLAIVLVAAAIALFFFIRWRRRHIDQMRHVHLSRTVSFENRAASGNGGAANDSPSGGGDSDIGYETLNGSTDGTAVKISSAPRSSQFEMSGSPNVF